MTTCAWPDLGTEQQRRQSLTTRQNAIYSDCSVGAPSDRKWERVEMAATILVVDDERNIRRTLQMVLSGAGFDTVEAGSAEEALKLLETRDVDRALLGLTLRNSTG